MKKFRVFLVALCAMICFSSATCMAAKFYDTKGTKYEGVVDRVAALGIINGISEKTFAPEKGLTRAEFAKIITYTKGLQNYADTTNLPSSFKDVKNNHWAKNYIMVATDLGLLKGYEDGTFRPEQEVTYAEFIAITLRTLGYVNIDETSGSTWYSGYIKRMFEIDLNKGMENFKSYDAPARRCDVAVMWWNMLVSDKWAVAAESEGAGLIYTYSNKTQLEYLFPEFTLVSGQVRDIYSGMSGDLLTTVVIGYRAYETNSSVPLHSLGATATGVYDPETKILYGLSIDEDIEDYKLISGPLFYLEELGYKHKKAETIVSYGSQSDANYAFLVVSNVDGSVYRTVYVDGSTSWYVETLKVEEISDEDDKDDEEDETKDPLCNVFLNSAEEPFTTNMAAVIVNGKLIPWEDVPEEAILTELVPGSLYTYSITTTDGAVTNYDKMSDLYIDGDRYIVLDDCEYTIYGETVDDDDDTLKVSKFSKLKKAKFEELLSRDITYHLTATEEIARVTFGRYAPSNVIDKYDNGDYRFFYIDSVSYSAGSSGEGFVNIGGKSFGGKSISYQVEQTEDIAKGAFVFVTDLDGKTAGEIDFVDSSTSYDDDMAIMYDYEEEYSYGGFGEYAITDETLVFQVFKYFRENSTTDVDRVVMQRVDSVDDIENLEKYSIHLLYNEEMNIDIVIAERDLNKAVYPVARVMDTWKYTGDEEDADDGVEIIELAKYKIGPVGDASITTLGYSGDCEFGELITYDPDSVEEKLVVKERFRTVFLGYKGDAVIDDFDSKTKVATVVGQNEVLDLKKDTFEFKGKEYDLLEYKFLFTNVRRNSEKNAWGFTLTEFYDKEDLKLKPGDRIAFGELNGIAVIYRGYSE